MAVTLVNYKAATYPQIPGSEPQYFNNEFGKIQKAITSIEQALNQLQTGPLPWTPVDVSGAGLVFTGVTTSYVKTGNLVFVYGRVTYPTTSNTSGAGIGGLPFLIAPGTVNNITSIVRATVSLGFTPSFVTQNGTSNLSMINEETAGGVPNNTLSGVTILFSAWYSMA